MPTNVAEETTAEKYLEASIERFLATRPVFTDEIRDRYTDEIRDRLGAALAPKPNEVDQEKAGSRAA